MFDESSMRCIFSLEDVADSHRSAMNSSIGDAFCTHASKLINLNVNKKYRMHEVNGCTSDRVSRSE